MQPKKIAFVHPDLGIGGAERLIVDAALGLQNEGHEVTIYTSHCDRSHCFEEVRAGQLKVVVHGDFLPTSLCHRFKILFASLRQLYLALVLVYTGVARSTDFFIVDQLSVCLPLLHAHTNDVARILFYCHFPDLKLARHDSLVRKLYRLPFDLLEQFTMYAADGIVVNSNFTKSVFEDTFTVLSKYKQPGVIYPCVNMAKEVVAPETEQLFRRLALDQNDFFLSINRFEEKKDIQLALHAYHVFRRENPGSASAKLVVAGGYDPLVAENRNYLAKLHEYCDELQLTYKTVFSSHYGDDELVLGSKNPRDVVFLPSITSNLKELLLSRAQALLYTPSFEHFGIVPLEAMKFGTPVIAVNNGGPVESIVPLDTDPENGTGWLGPKDEHLWALRLKQSLDLDRAKLAANGLRQLNSKFTRTVMINSFQSIVLNVLVYAKQVYMWEGFAFQLAFFIMLNGFFQFDPAHYISVCALLLRPSWLALAAALVFNASYYYKCNYM